MGEMIKFGIKVALTVATALAICAALLILYNLIVSFSLPNGYGLYVVRELFRIIGIYFPFNLTILMSTVTSLFAFKIAYWASDKMLWLIDVLG